MKSVILTLTYADSVDADTLAALLDAHSQDEGLVRLEGRLAQEPMEMRISHHD